jgi:DNA-binding protein HU-beta
MNKKEVIDVVASKTGLSKKDTDRALNTILDVVTETLQSRGTVAFTGFGTFSTSDRAARAGVNPLTKEKIQIPATTVPKFKAGKSLKEAVKK